MHFPCFIDVFVLCTKLCWYCFCWKNFFFVFCQRINSRSWKCQLEKPFQWWRFNIRASRMKWGTFLMVQWLRLWTSTAGGVGSILGWGTKTPRATWHGQTNKQKQTKKTLYSRQMSFLLSFFSLTHSLIHSLSRLWKVPCSWHCPGRGHKWCVLGLTLMVLGVQGRRVLSAEGWGQVFTGLSLEPVAERGVGKGS